ncbi:MAG: GIY-YIG nuclease family protein [Candidatus Uhrbacteria bacterium]|nr:GIY-YIG nuclease family protein [Candidatus Uhrbacteria bacterium]
MFNNVAIECPEPVDGQCCVYILECIDHSYYVGFTTNIKERLMRHEGKDASLWTTVRAPVALVYVEVHTSFIEARRRESQLKKWTRVKKERLISGEWQKQ